jgi:ribosome-associated heat shock protein Hsp15
MSAADAQRIDKWLWHARFARTRGAAQELARSGHVRVNREKVHDAARLVRAGDVLTLNLNRGIRVIRVVGIAERRDGFAKAQFLYEDAAQNPVDAKVEFGRPEPRADRR